MENKIYDEKNGLWYEKQGDYYIPAYHFPKKNRNLSAFGDSGIFVISSSISVFFTPTC